MAAFGRRRGRPPHPDILTPSESRVLDLIRQGRTNSEIAYELAISVPGVKYHVTNMLGKLGVADRAGLAAWSPDRETRDGSDAPEHGRFLFSTILGNLKTALAVGTVATLGTVTAFVLVAPGEGSHDPTTPLPFRGIPEGYQSVDAAELAALGMTDAGPILRSASGRPVTGGSVRHSLSVVALAEPAEILEGLGEAWTFSPYAVLANWVALAGRVDDRSIRVQLWAEDMALSERTVIRLGPGGTHEVSSQRPHEPPELLLSVTDLDTLVPYRAAIASNGHLFVGEATGLSPVIDELTGSELDVSGALRAHPIAQPAAGLFRFTGCDTDSDRACYVSVRSSTPLLAPVAGTLRCNSSSQVEVDHGDFIVRIRQVDTGYGGSPGFDCVDQSVEMGDEIGPGGRHWVYEAVDGSGTGTRLSVGVALDGSLYIGNFVPHVGCPCRSGT